MWCNFTYVKIKPMTSLLLQQIYNITSKEFIDHQKILDDFVVAVPDSPKLNTAALDAKMIEMKVPKKTRDYVKQISMLRPQDFEDYSNTGNDVQGVDLESIPKLIELNQQYTGPNGNKYQYLPKYIPEHIYKHLKNLISSSDRVLDKLSDLYKLKNRKLIITSGFRSDAYQTYVVIPRMLAKYGPDQAFGFVSIPGCSQHSNPIETAFDFTVMGDRNGNRLIDGKEDDNISMLLSPEFIALMMLAPKYGFWLPYFPDLNNLESGKSLKGINIETWHWQYVGDKAQALMDDNRVYDAICAYYDLVISNLPQESRVEFSKNGLELYRKSLVLA